MDFFPIAIFWSFAAWGIFSRRRVLLYLFFASMPFGSFAAIPPVLTAGLTFTPTPIVALLIIGRYLGSIKALEIALGLATSAYRLMLLALFWILACLTTILMPRLFAGQVEVIPMRAETPIMAAPLQATTQNISQLAYLTISVIAVFAFTKLLRSPEMRQHALQAMTLGGIVAVATGMVDYASSFVPLDPLLQPFRTATYALLTDVEVLGGKRVVGLMPEASSFGSLCLGFLANLYFFRRALADSFLRERVMPVLLALLILMVWFSTSSAAYVGLGVFLATVVVEWAWRVVGLQRRHAARKGVGFEFFVATLCISFACLILLFQSSLLDPLIEMVDRMVLQKTSSSSFEERGMWTAVSLQALYETFGLGVGIGGTRSSNAVVAVFSNAGLLAGLLYYGFILQSFFRMAHSRDQIGTIMISAFRWSFIPGFVVGLLAGTSADFGSFGAFRFGLVLAIALAVPVPYQRARHREQSEPANVRDYRRWI